MSAPGGDRWMGGVNYIKSIINSLNFLNKQEGNNYSVILIMYSQNEKRIYQDILDLVEEYYFQDIDLEKYSLWNKIKWKYFKYFYNIINPRLVEFLELKKIDLIYSEILTTRQKYKIKSVKWLPDFQFIEKPEGSSIVDRKARYNEFEFASKYADSIVLSSYTMKEKCEKYFPLTKGKTQVFRFSALINDSSLDTDSSYIFAKYNLPTKYFVISNLFAPTKNHLLLFKAIKALKDKDCNINLVCTGNLFDYRNPGFINEIFCFIAINGLYKNIFILGSIDRVDQVNVIRNSIAIIQPSEYEGWSTLVEEAKFLGKDLLLSNLEIHQEQSPYNSIYFNLDDQSDISEKIQKYWKENDIGYNGIKEMESIKNYKLNIINSAKEFINAIK